jgi:hypothetical protein
MAVRVLPHVSVRDADHVASLPGVVLALALAPSAIDLLKLVQPGLQPFLFMPALVAAGVAAFLLLAMWVRFPRTNWLAAASLTAVAALMLRFAGAEVAPLLSLLAIVAVGVGGGFSSPEVNPASA